MLSTSMLGAELSGRIHPIEQDYALSSHLLRKERSATMNAPHPAKVQERLSRGKATNPIAPLLP